MCVFVCLGVTTNDVPQFSNRNHYCQKARIDCFAGEHYIPSTTSTLAEGESAERFRELWRFAQERPKKKVWTSLTGFIIQVSIMKGISGHIIDSHAMLSIQLPYFFMTASAGALELSDYPLDQRFPKP